jgi:aspartate aminotransferase
MSFLADRLDRIAPSPSLVALGRARDLIASGKDVCNLTAGEPDFPTPPHIIEAAHAAMLKGETKYTAVDGTAALKQAISNKFRRENGLAYAPNEITVGAGAKQVLFNVLTCTVSTGDEVIIPAPYWVSYPDIVRFNGGTPVFVVTTPEQGYKITPAQLRQAITPRTKWLLINSPSNPTGAVYTEAELKALGRVLVDFPEVLVLTDDVYEYLVFDGTRFTSFAQANPQLVHRTVTVNAVSKSFSMTGWRLGYAGGPAALIRSIGTLQSQTSGNPSSVTQAAAVAALNGTRTFFGDWLQQYQARRDLVVSMLQNGKGLQCPIPQGAFFVYVSCQGLMGTTTKKGRHIESDADLSAYLLDEHLVATVHGAAYGGSPAIRLSFAAPMQVLEKACRRILLACDELTMC